MQSLKNKIHSVWVGITDKKFIKKVLLFGVTSIVAAVLNLGINAIGKEKFGISPNITYPVAVITVSLVAFCLFRFMVFPGADKKNPYKQGGQYILATVIFRCLEYLLFLIAYNLIHIWYIWAIITVQVIGTISKFLFYNAFIFGSLKQSAATSGEEEEIAEIHPNL